MKQTFTPSRDFTIKDKKEVKASSFIQHEVPSAFTINNILNYSKSLEIFKSNLVHEIEFVKS